MAELISFARGAPSADLLPVDSVREAAARALDGDAKVALSYGKIELKYTQTKIQGGKAAGNVAGGWDLKANQNFLNLQEELTSAEDRVAYARQFYNDSVLSYNTQIQKFPTVLLAGWFHFDKREFFDAAPEDTETPQVQF